jgi:hypothetical protein
MSKHPFVLLGSQHSFLIPAIRWLEDAFLMRNKENLKCLA